MKKTFWTLFLLVTVCSSAFAQLGSADKDLVYTPVTPCRVLDTRTTQGGTGAIAGMADLWQGHHQIPPPAHPSTQFFLEHLAAS